MLGSRVRTLCGFQKIGSTFHGYAQSPLFKGGLDVSRVRGRFTLLSQCFHRGWYDNGSSWYDCGNSCLAKKRWAFFWKRWAFFPGYSYPTRGYSYLANLYNLWKGCETFVERFERPRTPATPLFTGVPANPWKVEPFFENLFFLWNRNLSPGSIKTSLSTFFITIFFKKLLWQ